METDAYTPKRVASTTSMVTGSSKAIAMMAMTTSSGMMKRRHHRYNNSRSSALVASSLEAWEEPRLQRAWSAMATQARRAAHTWCQSQSLLPRQRRSQAPRHHPLHLKVSLAHQGTKAWRSSRCSLPPLSGRGSQTSDILRKINNIIIITINWIKTLICNSDLTANKTPTQSTTIETKLLLQSIVMQALQA